MFCLVFFSADGNKTSVQNRYRTPNENLIRYVLYFERFHETFDVCSQGVNFFSRQHSTSVMIYLFHFVNEFGILRVSFTEASRPCCLELFHWRCQHSHCLFTLYKLRETMQQTCTIRNQLTRTTLINVTNGTQTLSKEFCRFDNVRRRIITKPKFRSDLLKWLQLSYVPCSHLVTLSAVNLTINRIA